MSAQAENLKSKRQHQTAAKRVNTYKQGKAPKQDNAQTNFTYQHLLTAALAISLLVSATLVSATKAGAADINANYAAFMEKLQKQIKRNWHPSSSGSTGRVRALFTVRKDGTVRAMRIIQSGGAEADAAALKAIQDCGNFDALPEGAPATVDIEFTFDYKYYGALKPEEIIAKLWEGSVSCQAERLKEDLKELERNEKGVTRRQSKIKGY